MELFALYFNLLLFYIKLSFGFWIIFDVIYIYILHGYWKKENPKIESFPQSADLVLDKYKNIKTNIYIYIYI